MLTGVTVSIRQRLAREHTVQNFIRWLLPKEDHFFGYLENQGALCHEAALAFAQFKYGQTAEQVRDSVQSVEHRADNFVRQMEDALARTFVTPLDREDLHKLASELDDVVDITNLAARACAVYGVERPTEAMMKLMDVLVAATELLKEAVPKLRGHAYAEIIEIARKIRGLEKEADTIFRAAISGLFKAPNMEAREFLKQKEVLEDIERAVDHCDNVADLLSNLSVKHG